MSSRPSVWSFIAGLLWGMSTGIGLMVWVVVKLLQFQSRELERRHAWLRWVSKYRNLPAVAGSGSDSFSSGGGGGAAAADDDPSVVMMMSSSWEELDEEVRLLLRAVDGELVKRTHQKMDRAELQVAIRTLLEHRDEGNPSFAITAAVHNVRQSRLRQQQQKDLQASRGYLGMWA